ncbi:MAG: substrate-binding domain-containing protein [Clostridiales bacterium]|nr:substrate-binding domain-containing protein [Clostridiales bacterium]
MAIEFARQHLGLSKNDLQSFTSAGNAYDEHRNLIRKTLDQYPSYLSDRFAEGYVSSEDEHAVDLVLSTYPSEADLNLAKSSGENLKIEKVGVDAFIFIVNKDNPVESLTLDQVRDIYSGKVTNWSEVGGNDIPIIPYQRDEGTETQTGMEQLVMKGTPMLPPELTSMFRSMGKVLYPVAEYGNWAGSIGYTYLRYFGKLYEGKDIKILKIGGVGATQEALASERYPLAISYYGAVRESDGPDSAGHKFLEWILSSEGQESVKQAGYSPVR